jgi:DNA-binding YbaB/EbfC family protein
MSQFDLNALLEQAKSMQEKMQAAQAELGKKSVTGQAGGGMVTVTVNGLLELTSIKLDPLCVDARDIKMLEDLITAATNQALREARSLAERELGAASGLGNMLGGFGA